MDKEDREFREAAGRVAEWAVHYRETWGIPGRGGSSAGGNPRPSPERAAGGREGFDAIFRDFERLIVPGMTHWNHPRFFAYFPANNSEPRFWRRC